MPVALPAPLTSAAAYRLDCEKLGTADALGPDDSAWVGLAAQLDALSPQGDVSANAHLLRLCERIAPAWAPAAASRAMSVEAEGPDARFFAACHRVVDRMEDSGALNLGLFALNALLRMAIPCGPLEHGRVVAHAARLSWKLGEVERALAWYRGVGRYGREIDSAELKVRAWNGFMVVARLRGNYPRMKRWAARAAALADAQGLPELGSIAHHALMVAAGTSGRYGVALDHGWRAYELSSGDQIARAEMLESLAQTLLNAGLAEAAISGFLAAMSMRPPTRIMLPALGGYALAAATLGQTQNVRAAAEVVLQYHRRVTLPYASAAAIAECHQALTLVGEWSRAEPLRLRGLELANAAGFYELMYILEGSAPANRPPQTPQVRSRRAHEIAYAVSAMRPSGVDASALGSLVAG